VTLLAAVIAGPGRREGSSVVGRAPADALRDVLRAETRLLEELIAILQRQRAAVADDDLEAVEDSVFATRRVVHTLAEARRRRRGVHRLLGIPEDAPPQVLVAVMEEGGGRVLTSELRDGLAALIRTAQALSVEVGVNRRVLRQQLTGRTDQRA
jgi:hypothetical protein